MLRSLDALVGYTVKAKDGDIGKVYDFFFDDQSWKIRYLVVETGGWLRRRRVLIAPAALGHPDWDHRAFPVSLTQDQVRSSPDVDAYKPVSRQQETAMNRYYGWPAFRIKDRQDTMSPRPEDEASKGDPHLRSSREVGFYHVAAQAEQWGEIEDFLADENTWQIRQMVVVSPKWQTWTARRKVLVDTASVSGISCATRFVSVGLSHMEIDGCPVYDPSAPSQ